MSLTRSEALVERLCKKSFLSTWSYPNPRAGAGKELCDLLTVCDPDVLVFSVKEIALGDASDVAAAQRWRRKAIAESVKQIYGAERRLKEMLRVIRQDGTDGLPLPSLASRRIHRIAVALGSRGNVGLEFGDFGKGYVHVFDEQALEHIVGELDTIADFTAYLRAKEALTNAGQYPIIPGGEEHLLAVYLHRGRVFPPGDVLLIEPESWERLIQKPEWIRRKTEDRESYVWDGLIETLSELTGVPGAIGSMELTEREEILRVMAREDRFGRRILAKAFNEFMAEAARKETRSRIVPGLSGVVYVFLAGDRDQDRELRVRELVLRCFVARGLNPKAATVIGLATEQYVPDAGFSLDAARVTIPDWTAEHERRLEGIQADLGYFKTPRLKRVQDDEFPTTPRT